MKRSVALAVMSLCLLTSTAAFADYCINKDFTNRGTVPAYDIAVLITGNAPPTWIYNGNHNGNSAGVFSNFSSVFQGPNELLHWQNLNGSNQPINPGQLVHVGWCTLTPNSIVNAYWTDVNGLQLPGSVIVETGGHSANNPAPGVRWGVQWNNLFGNNALVSNVSFALASSRLPLDQLNAQNTLLASQLKPLPGGSSFAIPPGSSFTLPVQQAVAGQWIVLRYSVDGGDDATTLDFVQFQFGQ